MTVCLVKWNLLIFVIKLQGIWIVKLTKASNNQYLNCYSTTLFLRVGSTDPQGSCRWVSEVP